MRGFAGVGAPSRAELLSAGIHWPRPSVLETGLEALDGIGPKLAEAARQAGIATVGDLLYRFPRSHRDRQIRALASLENGETGTVLVQVLGNPPRPFRRGKLTMVGVKVGDESDHVRATWFNQPWVSGKLEKGSQILITGKRSPKGLAVQEWELVAPAVERDGRADDALRPAGPAPEHEDCARGIRARPHARGHPPEKPGQPPGGASFVPVHPATEDLPPKRIREWAEQAVRLAPNAIEGLPSHLRAKRHLGSVGAAIKAAHFPESAEQLEEARRRLGFEELFLHQALLATRKRSHRLSRPAPRFGRAGPDVERWLGSLPFVLTGDQRGAFADLDRDLDAGEPMQRLLMGEVGSGKTVVAVYAMLRALEAGYQAVLMAPTETLAEQHAITLGRLLAAEAVPFALLTGATPAPVRRQALNQLASGELGLILGTHALIEPAVRFARLGLCVVDEQHRFGVEQRRALDSKGIAGMAPHVLHMTATPIPRTLSLTAYGDLDTTALHQLPAGRKPVTTKVVGEDDREVIYEFLRRRLREGRQAFVVCPLVEVSDKLPGKAAGEEAERLRRGPLRDFRVGLLHGQMPSAEKAEAMRAFAAGETDVLVATTVIEVGIDVPNATVMVIEGAERFGVSQLHQLRGRVGRGEHPSQCLLFAAEMGGMARRRLAAVERTRDGFELAEVDLELRGEGEILGTRQSGLPRFAVASLPEDGRALVEAREEVLALLREHGSLDDPALGPLLEAARRRFGAGAADPIPL
ncbi:MAG TPA: ATP-dependent DNA helicase RecG [Solirubrobacterales bacterium]|nr:ATP-dependent DNA helicase RecG [Solirubrobacterales bacterium]